jgi:hypothetical protein
MLTTASAFVAIALSCVSAALAQEPAPPNGGRGAGTVRVWNPFRAATGHPPLTLRVLVLDYDPIVRAEGGKRLSQVFGWGETHALATQFLEAMEFATGGYLRHEIVEWRTIDGFYHQVGGHLPTCDEYVANRRRGSGWREPIQADYPRLLADQNVAPRVDAGEIDEVWIFSDHYFGLWEASMAGPGAFFINGGVYPEVPTRRPFAFYGFNYERGVAEMIHDVAHRTEATLNRAFGPWALHAPRNLWEKFSANNTQSDGLAGVGTCHWPPNAEHDYDYSNPRVVDSWAHAFLAYPDVEFKARKVSRDAWSAGPDYHLDYMKWYFAHLPRASGVAKGGRLHNWLAYIFDFQSYDAAGLAVPPSVQLLPSDVADSDAPTHRVEVCYRSHAQVDPATIGVDDVEIVAPGGARLAVAAVDGVQPSWVSDRVVGYKVAPPRGGWRPGASYRVKLRRGSVRDRVGKEFPGDHLGDFTVVGADSEFAVDWPDGPLDPGSRHGLRARRAESAKRRPAREAAPTAADQSALPTIAWHSSHPEIASVERGGVLLGHRPGTATITARSGVAIVRHDVVVRDAGLPQVRLVEVGAPAIGGGDFRVRMEIVGRAAIQRTTIATGALRITGPGGYHAFPVIEADDAPKEAGSAFAATVRISPRDGAWREDEVGEYRIELLGWRISDVDGRFAAPLPLGGFRLAR